MSTVNFTSICFVFILIISCTPRNEKEGTATGKSINDPIHHPVYRLAQLDSSQLKSKQHVYVPIYSEIYVINAKTKCLLTSTLSVRNTSRQDTLYVLHVDYFDSKGQIRKSYLEKPIQLHPLESIEFVVEYTEKEGGAGANFIVTWGASSSNLHPIIQAIMIGSTAAQQGISFVTDGVDID